MKGSDGNHVCVTVLKPVIVVRVNKCVVASGARQCHELAVREGLRERVRQAEGHACTWGFVCEAE